jgi:GT2 family glycosyltransferase
MLADMALPWIHAIASSRETPMEQKVEGLMRAAVEALQNQAPFLAWRLARQAQRLAVGASPDIALLSARALECLGERKHAIQAARQAYRRAPKRLEIAHYLLRLYALSPMPYARPAQRLACGLLGQDGKSLHILDAVGLLEKLQHKPIGACWKEEGRIVGWALNQPLLTAVLSQQAVSLKCSLPTPFLSQHGFGSGQDGFAFAPPADYSSISIFAQQRELPGSPLRGNPLAAWRPPAASLKNLPAKAAPAVDIIIPVYKGLAETQACLNSVLQSCNRTPHRVIAVNDASPEMELAQWLRELAQEGKIILLEQKFNTGFIGAVNRGMGFDSRNDVVLLNADTLTHGDWLDRLRGAAYHAPDIGTATPLSNHGELVSFPLPMQAAPMPDGELLAYLDAQCRSFDAAPISLPTGVGFCFYIRRACLRSVGLLDDRLVERGYGEESDFCLRAEQAGWRNVCAPNVFVAHQGSVSFGDEKQSLVARNLPLIRLRYPEHEQAYDKFLEDDPLYELRDKLQRSLLPSQAKTRQTLVLGAGESSGGPASALRGFGAARSSKPTLRAEFCWRKGWTIFLYGSDYIKLRYNWPEQANTLSADLRAMGFEKIQIHNLADWPLAIFDLITNLGVPYQITLHDYSGFCPRLNLLQGNDKMCPVPLEEKACADCIAHYGSNIKGVASPQMLRSKTLSLFEGAAKIELYTQYAASIYQQYFPMVKFHVRPKRAKNAGMIFTSPSHAGTFRIAVFDASVPAQGFYKVLQMARMLASLNANAELLVFGQSWDDAALLATGKAWMAGPVALRELRLFCRLHQCEMALHAVAWPEIDSPAIRLAQHCGLKLAVPKIGLYAEALDGQNACYLPPEGDVAQWWALMLAARPAAGSS